MHDSILPHLAQPSLMIDFLTRAYDVGAHVGEPAGGGPNHVAAGAPRRPPSLSRRRRAGLWAGGSGDLACGLQPCGSRPQGEGGFRSGWAPWLCVCWQGGPSASWP